MKLRKNMKVKMNRTCCGSPDGMQVNEYKKGQAYDVPETMATIFLKERWAVKVDQTPRRMKDQGAAPENKKVKKILKRKAPRGGHGT